MKSSWNKYAKDFPSHCQFCGDTNHLIGRTASEEEVKMNPNRPSGRMLEERSGIDKDGFPRPTFKWMENRTTLRTSPLPYAGYVREINDPQDSFKNVPSNIKKLFSAPTPGEGDRKAIDEERCPMCGDHFEENEIVRRWSNSVSHAAESDIFPMHEKCFHIVRRHCPRIRMLFDSGKGTFIRQPYHMARKNAITQNKWETGQGTPTWEEFPSDAPPAYKEHMLKLFALGTGFRP